ncbi:hypothetical protein N7499_006419 [Penicillium canescens]|uniref:Uncharacterized protein n=1 Tax=Penicillium canescens TaxID=5083 RepID=A0AAD6IDG0_PENCN|nr:uncharacterized protein N7446_002107 [Penicillium canescens]KAJ5997278.1 hypothetical protein N7522_008938 [Penicillium canescens]KAJ6043910.1 hypothetical protein N7460_005265 [Penicillium canescens]KAJ6055382.1 hypothetical protein N7444_004480 [Penicillium canescens]KAJ6074330.1 hypothetical protein N7446_002107 [Penicillium canescens]KAJ6081545.1 hypothetical protein N7499_006419 [Penicillium canescens]
MGDPIPALRYIKSQLTLYTLLLFLYFQQNPPLLVTKANPKFDGCNSTAPAAAKGNRRNRQNSDDSTASSVTDPIESLVDPQTLAQGEGQLIGPSAARELDKRNKKDKGEVEKKDDGSLNIRIHLDLHAKVRLDLEADLYGDIVIGLL